MTVVCRACLVLLVWTGAALAALTLPSLTGRVVDQAGVLSPAQRAAIEERLAEHEAATSNQVVVATVASLQGSDIESFANAMFREWRLGQTGRDNGVLLLVAPKEREVRIEVGYGLEGTLTDAISSDIVRNRMLPRFKSGDMPGGISAGADAILQAIGGTYKAMPRAPSEAPAANWFVMPIAFFLFFLFSQLRRRGIGPRGRRGWGALGGALGSAGFGRGRGGGWSSGGGGFSGGGGSSGGGGASGRW